MISYCFVIDLHPYHLVNAPIPHLTYLATREREFKNTDDWYNGMDIGKLVGLVFIDLKKAFDIVDHNILCKMLELYGVHHRELSWFKS